MTARRFLIFLSLVLLPALLCAARPRTDPWTGRIARPPRWTAQQLDELRVLSISNLGQPAPDPTNRVADDPEAALRLVRRYPDTIEALIVRFNTARRNSILAKARADYQNTNNNHREAVQYERLIAAAEKMPQAERKAIVESNPDVLKGRQQAVVNRLRVAQPRHDP